MLFKKQVSPALMELWHRENKALGSLERGWVAPLLAFMLSALAASFVVADRRVATIAMDSLLTVLFAVWGLYMFSHSPLRLFLKDCEDLNARLPDAGLMDESTLKSTADDLMEKVAKSDMVSLTGPSHFDATDQLFRKFGLLSRPKEHWLDKARNSLFAWHAEAE